MEREAKSNREVYESLLTREKELRVSTNSRTNNVRVVDRAEVPRGADHAERPPDLADVGGDRPGARHRASRSASTT